MKRIILMMVIVAVAAVSCLKKNNNTNCPYSSSAVNVPQSELDSVQAYLDSNNIEAVKHPSGFYYVISNPGAGTDSVELCSQILINYRGQLKNGQVFDQQNNQIFVLGSLIEGWKKGIPLLKKGGQIRLFIPPSLGYGNTNVEQNGQVVIPANSILIFDVSLLDFSAGN